MLLSLKRLLEKKGTDKVKFLLNIADNSDVPGIVTCLKFFIIKLKEKRTGSAHLLSF